jgi:translocation and assembly module TamB
MPRPGTVALSGTVGLLQPRIPVDLKLTADHAQAIANSLITANLDAALQIKGTALDRLDVVGSVQIHRATIGIPSALPPNVAVLDVRRRGRKAPRRSTRSS